MIDKAFTTKEEHLNYLKDVFKRMVALDMYFDIKNSQKRGKEANIDKIGTTKSNSNVDETTINKIKSNITEYLEKNGVNDKTENDVNGHENSIFSNDLAFSEISSERSNQDSYTREPYEVEDPEDNECFIQHIVNDILNLIKFKKLYYYFFEDPLVNYIRKKYNAHNQDLYIIYKKYFSYFNRNIQLGKGQIYDYLNNNLLCNLNSDCGQINIIEVLKNEINELGKEFNGLIINYYDSKVNLNEIYYLIEYYNLNTEKLSIDINSIQYGLRMDEPIIEYFGNREFIDKLLKNLYSISGSKSKFNYKEFFNLVSSTADVINKSKNDFNNNIERGTEDPEYCERKKIINSLLFQNVYGIENDLTFNSLYKLEPFPL